MTVPEMGDKLYGLESQPVLHRSNSANDKNRNEWALGVDSKTNLIISEVSPRYSYKFDSYKVYSYKFDSYKFYSLGNEFSSSF